VVKHLFFIFALLSTTSMAAFCQDGKSVNQLPVSSQTQFLQIAAKYHTGVVDYLSVESELKKSGIDFGSMSVEDAVMMMFMLIADDARKDMREMLADMEATRKKRAALREAETLLKKGMDSLKNITRSKYDSLQAKENISLQVIKLQDYNKQEGVINASENKAIADRIAAEKHLQSVEDEIKKLQQVQARKKQQ
jgi:hypothetical protein